MLTPSLISVFYPLIKKLSEKEKNGNEKFKFQHLLWAFLISLGIATSFTYIYSIWHIFTFGLHWNSAYVFIYPLFMIGLIAILYMAMMYSIILVSKASREKTLVSIPPLLYYVCFGNSCKQCALIFWQIYGIFIFLVSSNLLAVFTCGILLAFFADPVQVISFLAIYLSTFLCLFYSIAFVFKLTDDILIEKKPKSNAKPILCSELIFFYNINGSDNSVVVSGFIHATIVFISGTNNSLFFSIGELMPAIFAPAIGWSLR